jgi:hypothetical protein
LSAQVLKALNVQVSLAPFKFHLSNLLTDFSLVGAIDPSLPVFFFFIFHGDANWETSIETW